MCIAGPQRAFRNPFCSARVRPGAVRFVHSEDTTSTGHLVQRLIQQDRWGEIVGPHGTGKSTLVRELISSLDALRLHPHAVAMHRGPQGVRALLRRDFGGGRGNDPKSTKILIVDGAEQLSRWQRWRLVRSCRRQGMGLLVTSHRSLGLPSLVRTQVTVALARRIVGELLRTWPPSQAWSEIQLQDWIDRVDPLVAQFQGNLREVLFALYDQFLDDQR